MVFDVEEHSSQVFFHQQPEVEHHWLLEGVILDWARDISIDSGIGSGLEEFDHAEDDKVGDEALRTLGDKKPVGMKKHSSKHAYGSDNSITRWTSPDEEFHEQGSYSEKKSIYGHNGRIVLDPNCIQVVGSSHHQVHQNKVSQVEVSSDEGQTGGCWGAL